MLEFWIKNDVLQEFSTSGSICGNIVLAFRSIISHLDGEMGHQKPMFSEGQHSDAAIGLLPYSAGDLV